MTAITILTATHVIPMASPALQDSGIAFDSAAIRAIGSGANLCRAYPGARVIDLGDATILPGLINAHTHLELSLMGPPPAAPTRFVDWILALGFRAGQITDWETHTRDAVAEGIRQSLACGVTAVGDIAGNIRASRAALAASPLKGVSFGEVLGMAGRGAQFEPRLAAAIEQAFERPGLRSGIEPHAPYSLDLTKFRRCVEAARLHALPITTHLAETLDEAVFLADHSGEFQRLWSALDSWTHGVSTFPGGPIRAMQSVGLLDLPALLAHVNYADDDEIDLLAKSSASVVYCPRTHAYFNHPPHRFREMMSRGINVALGTDSAASSPDLNLLEEVRLVRRLHPDLTPHVLFELVTTHAARALGMSDRIGALRAGTAPDFAIFPTSTSDPLVEILDHFLLPSQTWIDGMICFDRDADLR